MDEQKIHIDNLYREKHGEFAGAPPSNVWDTLESRLDNTPEDKGFSFRWIWYVVIIVAALFLAYYIGKGFRKEDVQEPAKEQGIGSLSTNRTLAAEPKKEPETTITAGTTDSGSSAFATADQAAKASDQTKNTMLSRFGRQIAGRPYKEQQVDQGRRWHANRTRQHKRDTANGNLVSRQSRQPEPAGAMNSRSLQDDHTTSTEPVRTGLQDIEIQPEGQFDAPGVSQGQRQQAGPAVKKTRQNSTNKDAAIATSGSEQNREPVVYGTPKDTTDNFATKSSSNISKQTTVSSQKTHTINKPGSSGASATPANAKATDGGNLNTKNQSETAAGTTPPLSPGSHNSVHQTQVDASTTAVSKQEKTEIVTAPASAVPVPERATKADQGSYEIPAESAQANAAKTAKLTRKNAKKEKLAAKGKGGSSIQDPNPPQRSSYTKASAADDRHNDPADRPAEVDNPPSSGKEGAGATQNPAAKKRAPFSSWEFGLKAGYEFGLQTVKVNKLMAGPYAAYNISPRVSVAIQPSIKSGKLKEQVLSKEQAYVNAGGITTDTILIFMGGLVQRAFIYQQTYDSMMASYKMGGSLLEAEIPVTLRYRLSKHFTLSGGFTLSFGKILQVAETKTIYQGLALIDTFISNSPSQPLPDTSVVFIHTSPPFSALNSSGYQNPLNNPMRLGFLAGICYDHRRFLVELTLQQNISRLSNVPNADIKSIYKQPYIRILAGYRLW